jgi:hypothetical protein
LPFGLAGGIEERVGGSLRRIASRSPDRRDQAALCTPSGGENTMARFSFTFSFLESNTLKNKKEERISMKTRVIDVQGAEIRIIKRHDGDFISLTDMVKKFGDETILYNWLRNRNTIEFLGMWERINNPGFNPIEFERFRKDRLENEFAYLDEFLKARTQAGVISLKPVPQR